jgi:hypothetical protein
MMMESLVQNRSHMEGEPAMLVRAHVMVATHKDVKNGDFSYILNVLLISML